MIARRRGATALRGRAHARQWPGGPDSPLACSWHPDHDRTDPTV